MKSAPILIQLMEAILNVMYGVHICNKHNLLDYLYSIPSIKDTKDFIGQELYVKQGEYQDIFIIFINYEMSLNEDF